ncbi:MAG: ABC transporter permease subunit, partial [Actinobacteria bacterium]|nr:ABC transporter permease subunit [Actinomycetota bacterium]
YFKWLKNFVTGEWPRSIKGRREVWPALKDAMANTLRLGSAATVVGIFFGLIAGVLAALRPGGKRDVFINTSAFVGISIPPFISAIMFQLLFAVYWQKWFGESLFPTSGVYPAGHTGFDLFLMLKFMALPTLVVAIQIIATYSRYMRSSLLDVLNSDYMRTARSKGISERRVLIKHGMRNALIPVVTIAALDVGSIVGGLIITENIFSYPGMGLYFLKSFGEGDFPLLMPWMVVIVASVLFFNLIADISAVAGFRGGKFDDIMMRVTDLFLAFPFLVTLLVVRNVLGALPWLRPITGDMSSVRFIIVLFGLFGWMGVARIVRGQVLSLKEREFVEAARAVGASRRYIITRHLLPNSVGPIMVALTFSVVGAIIGESTLAFFGYGPQAGDGATSLGILVGAAKGAVQTGYWWLAVFPCLVLIVIALSINFIGDALRDATDPRLDRGV